jgi:hypothetical protein
LPGSANGVLDLDVDLGAVKSAATLVNTVFQAKLGQRGRQGFRGFVPIFFFAYAAFWLGRQIDQKILETKVFKHIKRKDDQLLNFAVHLLMRTNIYAHRPA